jgi:predicted RNA-binding Zn-ribbon protein involved in translation (DUF1610 family)
MASLTTCPACNYIRKPSDDAPDWECPKCHKAYIKTARLAQRQETESLPEFTNKSELPVSAFTVKYKPSAIPAMLYFMLSLASLLYVFVTRDTLAGVGVAILTMPWSLIGVALIDSMHILTPVLNSMNLFDHVLRVGIAVAGMIINTVILLLLCGYFKKSD